MLPFSLGLEITSFENRRSNEWGIGTMIFGFSARRMLAWPAASPIKWSAGWRSYWGRIHQQLKVGWVCKCLKLQNKGHAQVTRYKVISTECFLFLKDRNSEKPCLQQGTCTNLCIWGWAAPSVTVKPPCWTRDWLRDFGRILRDFYEKITTL